jgi:glycosyltransferase involved in cell wall biosynthesis
MAVKKNATYRICLIRHGYYPRGPRVSKEVRALLEAGYAIDVLCLQYNGQKKKEEIDGVRVYRLSHQHRRGSLLRYFYEYCLSFLKMFFVATALFFRNRYQCIQVNTLPDYLVFVTVIPRIFGVKVLLDMQEPSPELFITKYGSDKNKVLIKLIILLEQLSLKYADAALAVNESLRARFIQRGAQYQKIHVVRNVPDEEFHPGKSNHNDSNGLTLMTHGMIEKRYGQEIIVRALPLVRDKVNRLELFIAGYGHNEKNLRELAEELGCSDIITFTGLLSFSQIRELINTVDIGIVPLLRSPFSELCQPNKLFEYIACKKPVIVSRLEAVEESFDDLCVMFFEPGNHEELAECIVDLHWHPAKREHLVENAYKRLEPICWRNTKKAYVNVVNDLAGRKESQHA